MSEQWLADQFEMSRSHLRGVAYRILGSAGEADDAVQEAWLRLSRSDSKAIENLQGWLTTVTARVCLDMLRSRTARREEALEAPGATAPAISSGPRSNPEQEALMADSVGLALMVVLERLNPAERLAFVLHDMFSFSFDEIASITDRTPEAARQLASRARRRVRGSDIQPPSDFNRQRQTAAAFLQALRNGDVEGLIAVLDPDVVIRADEAAAVGGVAREARGAREWAGRAVGAARGARFAQIALVDGSLGLIVAPLGRLFRTLRFTFADGRISAIEIIGDPHRLSHMDLSIVDPN